MAQQAAENEKTIEGKLAIRIRQLGGAAFKMTSHTHTGLPDRLVVMPFGKVYWAELKSPGGKTSARQDLTIFQLQKLGHKVFVIDSFVALNDFLKLVREDKEAATAAEIDDMF